MEAEPQTFRVDAASPHSRTVTPTAAVRPRPRPPPALSARSRSIEHPMAGDAATTTDGGGVDDLAGALTELGRTDFVRKYSRKSRPVRSNDSTAVSPTASIDVRSAASSPIVTAASRYQYLRSPVLASAGCGGSARNDDEVGGEVDLCATNKTEADGRHNIPTHRDGDVRHLADQSPNCGTSGRRQDVVETSPKAAESDDAAPITLTRNPRAGTGLCRSESESSKMRSITLRSLRPRTMTAVSQSQAVARVPPPAPRGGVTAPQAGDRIAAELTNSAGVETDDEGVGAVDIDEPSFKDAYVSVTTSGGGATLNGRALLPSLQQYRDLPGSAWGGGSGVTRGRHQRFAEHGSPVTETSAVGSGTTGAASMSVGATPKTNSAGRFLTHPPLRERVVAHEPGSVDSNGLGALRDVSDPTKQMVCLASQVSFSSADSHICPSEDSSSLSHFGGDGNLESGAATSPADTSSADQLVRKNSKTQKQKSKSDPTRGEKNGDGSVVDIPAIVSGTMHAQSSPILLENEDRRRQQPSATQFPFTTDSASTSDLSDRGGAGGGSDGATTGRSDNYIVVGDDSAKSSPSDSMQDVAVRVVLKSDDSFEELPPTSIKPPRPKATKKRPRAPPSPLTTPTSVGAGDSLSSASSLVRKVFSKDRNGGSDVSSRLQAKDGSSPADLSSATSASSLTLPLSKKSSLLRSHSSAGNEAGSGTGGTGGPGAASRLKHAELPQSLVVSRQRSPGAPDSAAVVPRTGVVTASASVPELCDASGSSRLRSKDHSSLSTSYTPSLEPVLSNSTFTLFDGPAGDKVRLVFLQNPYIQYRSFCAVNYWLTSPFHIRRYC